MLRIAFCDDEVNTVRYYSDCLSDLLRRKKIDFEADTFTDSGKLLSLLYAGQSWDIYFLDIDMPLVNGLDLGKKIREFDENCFLIYISIRRELVFDTFETRAFRFIPKDEFHARIESCIDDLIKELSQGGEDKALVLESGGSIYRYPLDDLTYVRSTDKYVQCFLAGQEAGPLIRCRLSDVEEMLSDGGFLRIHKSYLVNYRYIRSIRQTEVVMDDGTHLPISRYRAEEIRQAFRRLTL